MQSTQTRRRLLATLSSATAAGLIGSGKVGAQEAPPETTTIRLAKNASICSAPQYIAGELLRADGFTDIEYVWFCRRRSGAANWILPCRVAHRMGASLSDAASASARRSCARRGN
jgi:hypothetical protein